VTWDPFGTLGRALWIGGGQWAGKSTVANRLAQRFGLTAYHHDYHNGRAHLDRRLARVVRSGGAATDPDPEDMWIRHPPPMLASDVLATFPEQFEWILDDLRALVSGRPVLAEGWALRPELVSSIADSADRMLVMVPTDEFRAYQAGALERARAVYAQVSDPDLAQRNRLARDRIVAADAVASARRLGVRVIEVDGTIDADGMTDVVADHFARYVA
jgi:hypothetical protein